jgi:hypothetical protein
MSSKTIVVGALALTAVLAAVVYFTGDSQDRAAATTSSASDKNAGGGPTTGAAPHNGRPDSTPLPPDPRLAALQVSPDNGLIKFVVGDNGKVIAEIDQDPASLGFGKPTREYTYMGDKVVALTAYRYMSDHVEISRTLVAYKPDGSVAEIKEATNYQDRARSSR